MENKQQHELTSQFVYKHILENFLDSYLVQRNAEKTFALVTEDIYSLGTGVHEVAHNKSEFRELIYSELEQLTTPITYNLDTYEEKEITPDVFVCICDVTTCIKQEQMEDVHYTTRLTAGFKKVDNIFLAYHLHMSEASAIQQEFEFFPLHYGEQESKKIDSDKQIELVELMKKMLPGGAMGGYVESGFPLYFVNDELLNWLGYTYDEFIGDNGQMMSNTMHPDDVAMVDEIISKAFAKGNEYSVEYRMKKKDHSYIWVRDIGRKVITPNGRVAMISIIADISNEILKQKSFEHTIESMKKERRSIDRLTGLLNREPAELLIEQHLIREQSGVFYLLDIDNFKLVNDLKGHPVGDQVLHTFAEKIKQVFPDSAIIARLGGDEFIVFLPFNENEQQLQAYAEKMLEKAEHLIDDELLANKLGVSIGISIAPVHGVDMKTLYSNADKVLYYAKRNGKSKYCFFEQSSAVSVLNEENVSIRALKRTMQSCLMSKGAFIVEYDTFSKIFQFTLRNFKRLQYATQIVLFSLNNVNESNEKQLQENKKILAQAIQYGLRNGDLMMDFSTSQIAVLLVNCNAENAEIVAKRIAASYIDLGGSPKIFLSHECNDFNEAAFVNE